MLVKSAINFLLEAVSSPSPSKEIGGFKREKDSRLDINLVISLNWWISVSSPSVWVVISFWYDIPLIIVEHP